MYNQVCLFFCLQELECDVSLEGVNPNSTGGQRQEFAFTLYDLDGHGKITEAVSIDQKNNVLK